MCWQCVLDAGGEVEITKVGGGVCRPTGCIHRCWVDLSLAEASRGIHPIPLCCVTG